MCVVMPRSNKPLLGWHSSHPDLKEILGGEAQKEAGECAECIEAAPAVVQVQPEFRWACLLMALIFPTNTHSQVKS